MAQLRWQIGIALLGFLLVTAKWNLQAGFAFASGVLASLVGSAAFGWRFTKIARPQSSGQVVWQLVAATLLKWGLTLAILVAVMGVWPQWAAAIVAGFGLALLATVFAAVRSA